MRLKISSAGLRERKRKKRIANKVLTWKHDGESMQVEDIVVDGWMTKTGGAVDRCDVAGSRNHWRCPITLKVKLFCVFAMKACGGSRGIAPFILSLVSRWRWEVCIMPRYPFNGRFGGPGRFGERKISCLLPGFQPRTDQAVASRYTDWASTVISLWAL